MKLINNKGLLFNKVSIIDILILVLILVGGYLGYSILKPSEIASSEYTKIIYTYESSPVSENFAKQLFDGAELFNSSRNHALGTLVSFEVKPREMEAKDIINGSFYKKAVEGEYTVVMTIEASATESDYNYYVTQENIKIGAMIPIKGKGFATNGYVVGLEEVNP